MAATGMMRGDPCRGKRMLYRTSSWLVNPFLEWWSGGFSRL